MEHGLIDVARSEAIYLEAVRKHQPASTSKIAEAVGVTRQGADYRLRRLEQEGKVSSTMIGNSLAWTLPQD